ncbi:MAG: hypothetical protein IJZ50_05955 [Alistipes sp.]|nr:hypothetical protein [Alistipes sp.]MBQ8775374.1 hypothetical protein [Alistipes sp.]
MTRLDLITKTITDALGYDVAEVTFEGNVADVTTTDPERFSVMLYERKAEQADEPCFSLSSNGIQSCRACKCGYFAYLYGNKACAIVEVEHPDYESQDEFGDEVYTYANPLLDE